MREDLYRYRTKPKNKHLYVGLMSASGYSLYRPAPAPKCKYQDIKAYWHEDTNTKQRPGMLAQWFAPSLMAEGTALIMRTHANQHRRQTKKLARWSNSEWISYLEGSVDRANARKSVRQANSNGRWWNSRWCNSRWCNSRWMQNTKCKISKQSNRKVVLKTLRWGCCCSS